MAGVDRKATRRRTRALAADAWADGSREKVHNTIFSSEQNNFREPRIRRNHSIQQRVSLLLQCGLFLLVLRGRPALLREGVDRLHLLCNHLVDGPLPIGGPMPSKDSATMIASNLDPQPQLDVSVISTCVGAMVDAVSLALSSSAVGIALRAQLGSQFDGVVAGTPQV